MFKLLRHCERMRSNLFKSCASLEEIATPLSRLAMTAQIFYYDSSVTPGIGQYLPVYMHMVNIGFHKDDDERWIPCHR